MILIQYNDEHGKSEKGCAFAHPLKILINLLFLFKSDPIASIFNNHFERAFHSIAKYSLLCYDKHKKEVYHYV